jgi:uncharacterized protein YcbX
MTPRLAEIWRHPIKAHGREPLISATLTAGAALPWDRFWAVAHDAAILSEGWNPCVNFSRGAKAPALMALSCHLDEATGLVTLHHPDRDAITFDPDGDTRAFLNWIAPLMPADRAASARVVRAGLRGMTDTDYPSLSLANPASHRAVAKAVGHPLSHHRWRANLWVEGLAPWQEFDWIGHSLHIGTATFEVRARITRCRATMANPDTGIVDADTLSALKDTWGHQDFGIYLVCTGDGAIAVDDPVTLVA